MRSRSASASRALSSRRDLLQERGGLIDLADGQNELRQVNAFGIEAGLRFR
jgi:hypothetical protein